MLLGRDPVWDNGISISVAENHFHLEEPRELPA